MIAVLTVFACHLWGWPGGGFVGVDVFFVISGFLITGNLLRGAEKIGTVSFRTFYWNRLRRIVPAATLVLILTYIASVALFQPFRANQVGIDALSAFAFFANWHFAIAGTDYFKASASVSPIQHYWSLSIEEQFYFVWPALIFLISLLVLHRAWTHSHRMALAAAVMGVTVAASLGWALYETATSPTWAYFNTFARVWELGVGAVLACVAGTLARIPAALKPLMSWGGLAAIAAALFLISDSSGGFPAPWALVPVLGAALVISAGAGGEPKYQAFLRNPVSGYIGDISYSLYLVHWPVIILLGTIVVDRLRLSIIALALSFGLAIVSYHFVENPLRRADWSKLRSATKEIRKRRYESRPATRYASVAALALFTVAGVGFADYTRVQSSAPPIDISAVASESTSKTTGLADQTVGPAASALQGEIVTALKTTEWPTLNPTMDSVLKGPQQDPAIVDCGLRSGAVPAQGCTWGSGPLHMVVVGDSAALSYTNVLRALPGVQLHTEALVGCAFIHDLVDRPSLPPECGARKQHAVDYINTNKPDVVIITNSYQPTPFVGSADNFTSGQDSVPGSGGLRIWRGSRVVINESW